MFRLVLLLLLICNLLSIDAFAVKHHHIVKPTVGSSSSSTHNKQQQLLLQHSPRISSKQPQRSSSSHSSLSMMGLGEAWAAYTAALEENPLLVKSITASVILGAADLTGQFVETQIKNNFYTNIGEDQSRNAVDETALTMANAEVESNFAVAATTTDSTTSVDWARVGRFALFGLVLQAPWNHFYYLLLDGVLPPTPDPWTATTAIKVVIDQFVQAPIFTVIIFIFLGTLEGKTFEAIQKQLRADYGDTMIANWKLWLPATVINIAFVPPILRVLYLNVVFFFWCIFLSVQLNKEQESS